MEFDLTYSNLQQLQNFEYEIYEEEKTLLEDLYIVRNALGETKKVNFILDCLGENWNVSIWDFPLFAEHLLYVYYLCFKEMQTSYLMLYYEQGIDRKLLFTKINETTIKLENVSGEKWISPLTVEYLNIEDLQKQILRFVSKIKEIIEVVYPEINTLERLQKWYQAFENKNPV